MADLYSLYQGINALKNKVVSLFVYDTPSQESAFPFFSEKVNLLLRDLQREFEGVHDMYAEDIISESEFVLMIDDKITFKLLCRERLHALRSAFEKNILPPPPPPLLAPRDGVRLSLRSLQEAMAPFRENINEMMGFDVTQEIIPVEENCKQYDYSQTSSLESDGGGDGIENFVVCPPVNRAEFMGEEKYELPTKLIEDHVSSFDHPVEEVDSSAFESIPKFEFVEILASTAKNDSQNISPALYVNRSTRAFHPSADSNMGEMSPSSLCVRSWDLSKVNQVVLSTVAGLSRDNFQAVISNSKFPRVGIGTL